MRTHLTLTLTLTLSTLLTACTGGGQTTPTPPTEQATLPSAPTELNAELLTLLNEVRTQGTVRGQNVIPGSCAESTFQPGRLAPLRFNPRAAHTAQKHAQYLFEVGYEAHAERNTQHPTFTGATLKDRWHATLNTFGPQPWTLIGENVAGGQESAAQVTRDWMSSPGHCRNIMEPTFTSAGLSGLTGGVSDRSATPPRYPTIWVQVFVAD